MNVKICGIRTLDDALAALDAGAWAIGLVFHKPSPRYIDPRAAARIVSLLPRDTLAVGVFVDLPLDEVNWLVERVGLRGVQLHGEEGPEYAAGVRAGLVIKALRVTDGFDPARVLDFPGCRILLDTHDPALAGGTGRSFDWSVARRAGEIAPIVLAGGIGPENVAESIRQARPSAIDVSSGVESAPGVKDRARIKQLFEAIRGHEERES